MTHLKEKKVRGALSFLEDPPEALARRAIFHDSIGQVILELPEQLIDPAALE